MIRRFRVWRHRRKMNPAPDRSLSDRLFYLEKYLDEVLFLLEDQQVELHELGRVDVNDLIQRVQALESRATAEEIVHYNESYERI